MSDLNIDAIRDRTRMAIRAGYPSPDPRLTRLLNIDIPALLAEVERLRANQMPDGGFWDVDYFTTTGIGFVAATDTGEATYQRRVWHGRIEPIQERADD